MSRIAIECPGMSHASVFTIHYPLATLILSLLSYYYPRDSYGNPGPQALGHCSHMELCHSRYKSPLPSHIHQKEVGPVDEATCRTDSTHTDIMYGLTVESTCIHYIERVCVCVCVCVLLVDINKPCVSVPLLSIILSLTRSLLPRWLL